MHVFAEMQMAQPINVSLETCLRDTSCARGDS